MLKRCLLNQETFENYTSSHYWIQKWKKGKKTLSLGKIKMSRVDAEGKIIFKESKYKISQRFEFLRKYFKILVTILFPYKLNKKSIKR